MSEDLINLPSVQEIKEMLKAARNDIATEIKQDPELVSPSKLLIEVIDIIDERIAKEKDLSKLNMKDKIYVAAHLNFLTCLFEDFFYVEDFDEFDEDMEELEESEFEDEK
ncbi:MAG: hypothetical protein H0W88_00920 [Parachlamydiaceae bacterium]|nr:hypothetical protein [Parachlamydiaceae bacterium]